MTAKTPESVNNSYSSWVDLLEEEDNSSDNLVNDKSNGVSDGQTGPPPREESNKKLETQGATDKDEVQRTQDENTPIKIPTVVKPEEGTNTEKSESPWNFSYATVLKNSANKSNIKVSPNSPTVKKDKVEPEQLETGKHTRSVKREIQREFLQEDLSLSSHLDIIHMQSPMKHEIVDAKMSSPLKTERELRSSPKKRFLPKISFDEEANMPDDVLMPSPKKVTRLTSRRKREPGESPLTNKRSKPSSESLSSPKCVVSLSPQTMELETDEQVLMRRQKQIDYGKNTVGYERYCQMIPKHKRSRKHPQTPPKNVKYSRRAWDGLVKQWRQQLHFWDPPSEGGGNIEDLDISSMSEASSDTASMSGSLPATPREGRKSHRYSRTRSQHTRSSASETSSIADDSTSGFTPLK